MDSTALRTFVGSVVCIDLVGYSKRSVAQQGKLKERFNKRLVQAVRGVSERERVILDTGDGALVGFLGDPGQCLDAALRLRTAMRDSVRIGIHLGSVKMSAGMSGAPRIVGDAVNIAERIAGIAEPGEIVVSRAFHDMVSRLSDRNATLFRSGGIRVDRAGQQHEVFVIAAHARNAVAWAAAAAIGVAAIGAGTWLLVRKSAAPPAPQVVAEKAAPAPPVPAAPAPAVAEPPKPPPKPERRPATSPEPRPIESRSTEPRSREAPWSGDPGRILSNIAGGARDAALSVGSATQNVLSTVKDKTLGMAPGPVARAPEPTVVSRAATFFPPEATRDGIRNGSVRARLEIDAAGKVSRVTIVSADPPGYFEGEATRSFHRWRFNPGAPGRSYEAELDFRR